MPGSSRPILARPSVRTAAGRRRSERAGATAGASRQRGRSADRTAVPPAMTAGTSSGLHHTHHPPPQCGHALDPLQPRHLERHTTHGHDRREERIPASVELRPPERHDRSRRRADCRRQVDTGWPAEDAAPQPRRRGRRGDRAAGRRPRPRPPSRPEPTPVAAPPPRPPRRSPAEEAEQVPGRPDEGDAGRRRGRPRARARASSRPRPRPTSRRSTAGPRPRPPTCAAPPTTTSPRIREWSKAEIARIREETEQRITGRKADLETEIEEHAARHRARDRGGPGAGRQLRGTRWPRSSSASWPRRIRPASPRWPRTCPSRRRSTTCVGRRRRGRPRRSRPRTVAETATDDGRGRRRAEAVGEAEPVAETDAVAETGDVETADEASRPTPRPARPRRTPRPTSSPRTTPRPRPTGEAGTDESLAGYGEGVDGDGEVDREAAFAAIQAAAEAAASAEVAADAAARAEAVADVAIEIMGNHEGEGEAESDPRFAALGLSPDYDAAEAEALASAEASSDEEIPEIGDDALAARLAGLVPGQGQGRRGRRRARPRWSSSASSASRASPASSAIWAASPASSRSACRPGPTASSSSPSTTAADVEPPRRDPVPAELPGPRDEQRRRQRPRHRPRSRGGRLGRRPTASPHHPAEEQLVARPAIVIALPMAERRIVADELRGAGFEAITVGAPDELEALLQVRHDVAVAILDGETDLDTSLEYYGLLHEGTRKIPALMVMSPSALDRMFSPDSADEFFSRPYTADSIRWRVEAMCIRSMTVDDGSGPDHPGRLDGDGRLVAPGDRHRDLQPEGRRRQDDHRHEPRGRAPAPSRPEGPAHRRRHRDRPRRRRRSGSSTSGPSPTAGTTRPRAARSRRSPRSPRPIRRA